MRITHRLLPAAAAALLLWPTLATAQPGSPPPPPPDGAGPYGDGNGGGRYAPPPPPAYPEFHPRYGLNLGFSVGLGGMNAESGPICPSCEYDPIAGGFELHLGGMMNPRLAIKGVLAVTGQQGDEAGLTTISQTMLLGAVQYWLMRQVWIEGGVGASVLSASYDDGYVAAEDDIDQGLGIMAAVGVELLSAPNFALDLQLRLARGSYGDIDDSIDSAMIGVGFNWF